MNIFEGHYFSWHSIVVQVVHNTILRGYFSCCLLFGNSLLETTCLKTAAAYNVYQEKGTGKLFQAQFLENRILMVSI